MSAEAAVPIASPILEQVAEEEECYTPTNHLQLQLAEYRQQMSKKKNNHDKDRIASATAFFLKSKTITPHSPSSAHYATASTPNGNVVSFAKASTPLQLIPLKGSLRTHPQAAVPQWFEEQQEKQRQQEQQQRELQFDQIVELEEQAQAEHKRKILEYVNGSSGVTQASSVLLGVLPRAVMVTPTMNTGTIAVLQQEAKPIMAAAEVSSEQENASAKKPIETKARMF